MCELKRSYYRTHKNHNDECVERRRKICSIKRELEAFLAANKILIVEELTMWMTVGSRSSKTDEEH